MPIFFSNLGEIQNQFRPVLEDLDHVVICCEEYEAARELMGQRDVIWYGRQFPLITRETSEGTGFKLKWNGEHLSFQTNMVGKYNIDNISAVVLYALNEGFSYEKIRAGIKNLKQVKRRQELRGYYRGCPVIDDFCPPPPGRPIDNKCCEGPLSREKK